MHNSLKTIIVNSNVELQSEEILSEGKAAAEVNITSSRVDERMDIEISDDDNSATIA
jgi:hypothetical protein